MWTSFTSLVFFLAVILACGRSEVYFYVYYVANIIAGVFCEGTMHCLCLAYVVKTTGRKPSNSRVTYILIYSVYIAKKRKKQNKE